MEQIITPICDNDSKRGIHFAKVAAGAHVEVFITPVGAPIAIAVGERLLGLVRRECLDHLLVVGLTHLQQVIKDYITCFNHQRLHQENDQLVPVPPAQVPPASRTASTAPKSTPTPNLGGLPHVYQQVA